MNLLESALNYERRGFSVIPVKSDKKPFIKWEEFQKRRASRKEIREWWSIWRNAGIGIVTGGISGICVIDIDTDEGKEAIQQYISDSLLKPTCQTPKGGQHLYFKYPDKPIGNNSRLVPGCDFRGEGGYVIAPPSVNGVGKSYQWIISLDEAEPPPLPEPYLLLINSLAVGGG